jgi:poly(A) polymerase
LRYFRFVGRIGVTKYDAKALSAIHRLSPNLNKISGERVWMEMSKILTGDLEVLDHMVSTGVLTAIGIEKPDLAAAVCANTMGGKPETVLAALVGTQSVANGVADAWKLSRDERKMLAFISGNGKMMTNTFDLHDWKVMVVVSGDKDLVLQAMCLTLRVNLVQAIKDWTVPTYPLTGADILAMGVDPSPEVGRRLGLCKVKWMDSEFTMTKDELVELAAVV